jgi:hypothetical protein
MVARHEMPGCARSHERLSDPNGTAFWRSMWLICEASVVELSFFIFCYRRLRGNHRHT